MCILLWQTLLTLYGIDVLGDELLDVGIHLDFLHQFLVHLPHLLHHGEHFNVELVIFVDLLKQVFEG